MSRFRSLNTAFFVIAIGLAGAAAADAQPTPDASPAASPAPAPSPSAAPAPAPPKPFTVNGFVDLGYTSANNTNRIGFTNGNLSRILDGGTNAYFDANGGRQLASPTDFESQPNFQAANLTVAYNGPIGVKVEALAGSDSRFLASNGQSRQGTNLLQAYLSYAAGPATLLVGKFESVAGAEVPETTLNSNFSRDYLYAAVPTSVTGARISYVVNPKITLIGGVNNGWDDVKFAGKKKTLEGSIQLAPSPGYALNLATLNGNDFLAFGNSALDIPPNFTNRTLYDAVLTVHATSALSIVANYDRGTQLGDAVGTSEQRWNGIAGYVNYTISPLFGISLRKETFHDANNARLAGPGSGERVQSNTATLNYTPSSRYIVRGEYRLDTADANSFTYAGAGIDPATGLTAGRPHQSSVAVEVVYKFP